MTSYERYLNLSAITRPLDENNNNDNNFLVFFNNVMVNK